MGTLARVSPSGGYNRRLPARIIARRLYNRARSQVAEWVRAAVVPAFGHQPSIRFVIICRTRTGSTHLVSLIQSHPNARCHYEVLSPHSLRVRRGLRRDAVGYFQKVVFRHPRRKTRAIGFKLMYFHGRTRWSDHGSSPARQPAPETIAQTEAVWEYLIQSSDIRIIHLTRRNVLRTLISDIRARQSGQWTSRQHNVTGVDVSDKIHLDPHECRRAFELTRAMEDEARDLFRGHPFLEVTYEELTDEPQQVMIAIERFLGLDPHPLRSRFTKQYIARPIRDTLDNYEELRTCFAGTQWETFFDD